MAGQGTDWMPPIRDNELDIPLPVPEWHEPLAMRFCRIPAGEFWMGSRGMTPQEEPRRRVVVKNGVWIAKYVVTQAQWAAIVDACGSPHSRFSRDPSHFKGPWRPVETVSWDECTRWCDTLFDALVCSGTTGKNGIRSLGLPTEAEWEAACRAMSYTAYWNGDGESALSEVGWYATNSGHETHDVTEDVVPGFPENHPYGVCGMHGNVWELCSDTHDLHVGRKVLDGASASDPWRSSDSPDMRSARGGAILSTANRCRSAHRSRFHRSETNHDVGFRICMRTFQPRQLGAGEAAR